MTDQLGRTVNIPFPPKRIISTVPSQTELLFWLGLDENIVGITRFCIHPKELCDRKTRIGGTKKLDTEKIRLLQPDLIIANKEENEQVQIEELAREVPVWISDVHDLESAVAMILSVAEMTDNKKKAEELIDRLRSDLETLHPVQTYKTAYLIWRKPYMTIGGDTFINDMLKRCGLVNVFGSRERYPPINAQELAAASPELILLSSEPYPFRDKHIAEFQAVCPSAKVMLVDGEMFSWYGSRMLFAGKYFRNLMSSLQAKEGLTMDL